VHGFGDLQDGQDHGDGHARDGGAGQGFAAFETQAQDAVDPNLGQQVGGEEGRNQQEGRGLREELAQVEGRPAHHEEDGDEEPVADGVQADLGIFMWLEEFHHDTGDESSQNALGPNRFGEDHQAKDQEEGQADVQLGGRLVDAFVEGEEGFEPQEEHAGGHKDQEDQPERLVMTAEDGGVEGQRQQRHNLPQGGDQQDGLAERLAEELLFLEGRDDDTERDGHEDDGR